MERRFDLSAKAKEVGLEFSVVLLEGKTLAQFNEGPHTVAEHDSIEEAATWLDGYLKGVMRQKSLDRTVC